ncbi:hypothetical protein MM236_08270 [Belliella sp. DSM 107340]|uniref:Uncharacterized protein n=1 Tax=Belliella calami TaxID=2923436 RepID=A0ABS9UN06_9BACT|nr:hypothetical protein [Belliella calami]MCH7397981.1 hypothetical protein [Belliella calami]
MERHKLTPNSFKNLALHNLKENFKQKSYKIIEISDADDPYSNAIPHDGVAYQNKLFKKVRVKAVLQ